MRLTDAVCKANLRSPAMSLVTSARAGSAGSAALTQPEKDRSERKEECAARVRCTSLHLARVATRVNACLYPGLLARMQVYLPTDLYEIVKERGLPLSELLEEAVRTEVRRQELQSAIRSYTSELAAQVGQPGRRTQGRAVAVAQRIAGRTDRQAG